MQVLILILHKWVFYFWRYDFPKYKSLHSVVIDEINEKPRSIISMYEVLGHGVAFSIGYNDYMNNESSVQVTNLVHRFYGIDMWNGTGHEKDVRYKNPYDIPFIK